MTNVPFPDFEHLDEDEYLVSWTTRDWDLIHRCQDYFGMPRFTTLNYISKIKLKQDDPRWYKFVEGEQKGIYRIRKRHR